MKQGPDILILKVDQPNGTFSLDGPADWQCAPKLKRLPATSRRFAKAYVASPLRAPGRASSMSGLLPLRTWVNGSAAESSSATPTYARHLRRANWQTCLSSRMHVVGPDQLHGYGQSLTTDIYPADFGRTPDDRKPGEGIDWWYRIMGSVTGSGAAEINNRKEYDDAVAHFAKMKLCDYARGHDPRPWYLTVSFAHPHDPYVDRREFRDLYVDCAHLDPQMGEMAYDDHAPQWQRIRDANDLGNFEASRDDIRRSRSTCFAKFSYLDGKVGRLLDTPDSTGQGAVTPSVADHGDLQGERGLGCKMSFLEASARVPLMHRAVSVSPEIDLGPVCNIDVCPPRYDHPGVDMSKIATRTTGESLLPTGQGGTRTGAIGVEGSLTPMLALRQAGLTYTRCALDPEQLVDPDADRHELTKLADGGDNSDTQTDLGVQADTYWDLDYFEPEIRGSRARRRVGHPAFSQFGYYPWGWQPKRIASQRYMRNRVHLDVLKDAQRAPRGQHPDPNGDTP